MDMLCNCVSEGRRNALQDYQKAEGIRLVVMTPDSSHLTKSKKVSMAKCAKACSRNRRLPFTCRYVCSYGITISAACKVTLPHSEWLLQRVRKREYTKSWWFLKFLNYACHRYDALLLFWFSRRPVHALHTHVIAVLPWVNFCVKKLKKADHYLLHSSPLLSCSFPFLLILQSVPLWS